MKIIIPYSMLDKNIYRNSRFCHLPFAIPKSMKNQHQPQLQYIQKEECKNQSTKAHRTEAHKSIFSNIVHLPDGDGAFTRWRHKKMDFSMCRIFLDLKTCLIQNNWFTLYLHLGSFHGNLFDFFIVSFGIGIKLQACYSMCKMQRHIKYACVYA